MNTHIKSYLEANLNSTWALEAIWESRDYRWLDQDHLKTKKRQSLTQKRVLYDNLCTAKAEAALARKKYHSHDMATKQTSYLNGRLKVRILKIDPLC